MSLDNQDVQKLRFVHGALRKNERLKLYKRASTWVLTGIIVGLILLGVILTRVSSSLIQSSNRTQEWQDTYNTQLEQYNIQLKNDPDQPAVKSNVERLTYLIEHQISPSDWRTDAAEEYYNLKYGLVTQSEPDLDNQKSGSSDNAANIETPSVTDDSIDAVKAKQQMDKLWTILDQNDWRSYIQARIDGLESGAIASANESEKQVDIDIGNLYLDNNITPVSTSSSKTSLYTAAIASSNDSWKSTEVQNIRDCKLYLLRGENAQGSLLTHTQRNDYQNAIDVSVKRLKTNAQPIKSDSFLGLMESSTSSLNLFTIILVVLAGMNLASEYGTGTVKLLLITPHKRQKIFWSKTAVLLEVTLLALAVTFVLSFLISGALTGFKGIGDMQVISLFSQVLYMPYLVYILIKYLLLMLPVLTYGALALMFSVVTRKSAAAIAVSLILMYGGNVIMLILSVISSRMVIPGIKFLLFANTSLESYLPSASSSMTTGTISQLVDNTMTLGFSVAVLLVYMACFLWIARDSFCRRDVK